MSLIKKHLKTRPVCKVTFTLTAEAANKCQCAYLVGDFNDWKDDTLPMKKRRDGSWNLGIELEPGREYQFLYHLGEKNYLNDDTADARVPNPFGSGENSVIRT